MEKDNKLGGSNTASDKDHPGVGISAVVDEELSTGIEQIATEMKSLLAELKGDLHRISARNEINSDTVENGKEKSSINMPKIQCDDVVINKKKQKIMKNKSVNRSFLLTKLRDTLLTGRSRSPRPKSPISSNRNKTKNNTNKKSKTIC